VAEYIVEVYVGRGDGSAPDLSAERAQRAAEELTREGTPVEFLRAIFVPEDETCFYLYDAESVDAVRRAASRAVLRFERVAEAVALVRREEIQTCR
jgi:hypothetical protein